MKNLIIILVIIGLSQFNLDAQILGRTVISSVGNSLQNTECQVNFTMGEFTTNTSKSDTCTETQGFHQGVLNYNISTVEIEDNLNIKIYPNPANEVLKIKLLINTIGYSAEVYDIAGKLVLSKRINIYESLYTINTTSLSSGLYFIRLVANDNSFVHSQKFTVAK